VSIAPTFPLAIDAFIVRLHCLPKHCFPLLGGKVGTASSEAANNPYQQCLEYDTVFVKKIKF